MGFQEHQMFSAHLRIVSCNQFPLSLQISRKEFIEFTNYLNDHQRQNKTKCMPHALKVHFKCTHHAFQMQTPRM